MFYISSFVFFSAGRDIPQEFHMPTSRIQVIAHSQDISGGTKSLTNSPLLIGKTRRGVSALYGNSFNTRDRFSNMYNIQQRGSDINHVDINTNQTTTSDNFIPRHRRLSGSQQQVL